MVDVEHHGTPSGYVFAVAGRPYCCWDYDHVERGLEFLDGFDTEYFEMVAGLCLQDFEAPDDQLRASVLLRTTYHQAVETLLSLLGAALQAPLAIPAWFTLCSTGDLTSLAASLRDGRSVLTWSGAQRVSFHELSERVHGMAWPDEDGEDSTAARFGKFWRGLSGELLDESARAEYNALKHGNRVRPGGFTLAIGLEETPGVAAPPEAMRSLGGSQFGSTFFTSERVGSSKEHIRAHRRSVNWSPEVLAKRLVLISMSLKNVVGSLRCALGIDPSTVEFVRPVPLDVFEEVWMLGPSVRSSSIDVVIRIDPADELSRDQLLDLLEGRHQSE